MKNVLKIQNSKFKIQKIVMLLFIFVSLVFVPKVEAAMSNTVNFQTKIIFKTSGLNLVPGTPACVSTGADTCDFRVRIWNLSSGGTTTAGTNLLYEELFTDAEISNNNGILYLVLNSVCGASYSGGNNWGSTVASSTVCVLVDDSDADSATGVNFDRNDLWLEITFDPSGAWTDLASPPGGIETFTRTNLKSVPSAFVAQTLSGKTSGSFVQLSPAAVQSTSSGSGAIRVNQAGAGNILQLQSGGSDKLVLNNAGQLQLSTTGNTGGLLIGGDVNLYRDSANVLKTDDAVIVGVDLSVLGLSNFTGNLRSVLTVSNGSTTTTGTGASSRNLTVASTTNFEVGNIIFLNGTSYHRIDSVDSTTQITITPAASWSASQTVVEYTAPKIGGDGSTLSQQFDTGYFNNGIRTGGGTDGTTYADQLISSNRGLAITAGGSIDINSQGTVQTNQAGTLSITKNPSINASPSWAVGKAGGEGRSQQSSVVYNGKAYLWSGSDGSNTSTAMYVYDITKDSWSAGTSGGSARRLHTAVGFNNKMYAWGGIGAGGTAINSIDIYDFTTNAWSTGASGGTARWGHTAVVYENKIYFWGGNNDTNPINTIDIYDVSANSWTTGTAGGTARDRHSVVFYNNKMFLWGGHNGTNAINTLDIYDFKTNLWTTGTAGGTARNRHTVALYNSKMYIWGGENGSATIVNTMDIYDFATSVWTTGTTGGTARRSHSGFVYNQKWFNWGGATPSVVNSMDVFTFGINDVALRIVSGEREMLNISTENVITLSSGQALGLKYSTTESSQYSTQGWTTGTAGGTGRRGAASVEYNGKIYMWAGCTNNGCTTFTNSMDIYDINTGVWTTGATGGTTRWEHEAQVYNGKIYYVTGCTNTACSTVTGVVDIYDIASNTWSTGLAGGNRGMTGSALYNGKIIIWGGYTGAANLTTVGIYDIAANTWTTGASGGTGRRQHASAVYNGKMYNWGGFVAANTNIMDIYDINNNTWSTGTAGGTAKRELNGIAFEGKVYFWGGFIAAATNAMDIYDIGRNAWITGTAAGGTARYGHSSILYQGKMINPHGTNGAATINTVDIYNFGSSNAEEIFYIGNANGSGPDNGKLFRFDATGRAFTSEQGGWFSVGADYAEYMYTKDTSLRSGEIVKLDTTVTEVKGGGIERVTKARDSEVIGVISTEPGFVGNIKDVNNILNNDPNWKLLSMVGQVEVIVNCENGEIRPGDRITTSSTAGEGMKADSGDVNIGIAQETYDTCDTQNGRILVMITRNNEGINNKVQINMGENGEGGFRVSNEGKMQYKNADQEWKDIQQDIAVDDGVIWTKVNDKLFANVSEEEELIVGVDEANQSEDTKLQVSGGIADLGVKGLKYIKLNGGENKIEIGGEEIGIRLSEDGEIEYRDKITNSWISLNGMTVDRGNRNSQISGWGFISSNGTNSLAESILLPTPLQYTPYVNLSIVGKSTLEPNSLMDCNISAYDVNGGVSKLKPEGFEINIKVPVEGSMYYCYTWLVN
jgi:hypothetical protein